MLRSVHLKNFVGFKDHQVMDFSNDGPFILIGENGSGKSSVLEGIRRCLNLGLSTSISSVPDSAKISYVICNVETDCSRSNDVVLGIVSKLNNPTWNQDGQNEMQKHSGAEEVNSKRDASGNESTTKSTIEEYYKFAISRNDQILVDLIILTKSGDETNLKVSASYMLSNENSSINIDQCIDTISNVNQKNDAIEQTINSILENLKKAPQTSPDKLKEILKTMTEQFVFTFPSRSMAPYQWSKSERHTIEYRNKNYEEAVNRSEIINYYFNHLDMFDRKKEETYFRQITEGEEDNFKQMITGENHSKRGKFALIKTPEGILGAKEFSILISSKQFKTILLEEPERGMHPQFVERMVQIMKQEKINKRVILTTHQKGIITPWTIPDTFIFRRREKGNHILFGKNILDKEKKESMKNMRLLTSHNIPDIFFARKVLFYEGDSEELLLRELKSQILAGECAITSKLLKIAQWSTKKDIDDLKISLTEYTFIKMNGEGQSKFYRDISEKLELEHLFLLDKDKGKKEQVQDGIFYWKDGDIEKMVLNMCTNNTELKTGLIKQGVIVDNPIRIKCNRGKGKLFLDKRITCDNITESVRLLLQHCKQTDDLALLIKKLKK